MVERLRAQGGIKLGIFGPAHDDLRGVRGEPRLLLRVLPKEFPDQPQPRLAGARAQLGKGDLARFLLRLELEELLVRLAQVEPRIAFQVLLGLLPPRGPFSRRERRLDTRLHLRQGRGPAQIAERRDHDLRIARADQLPKPLRLARGEHAEPIRGQSIQRARRHGERHLVSGPAGEFERYRFAVV